jgi:PadR family transcriptional regulator, regulatory protein PadR
VSGLKRELVAVSAEPLILSLLSAGESCGYTLIDKIRARSLAASTWPDGMFYPVFHRMQRNGWIRSRWVLGHRDLRRKHYSLTAAGRNALSEESAHQLPMVATCTAFWKRRHV